MRSEAVEAMRSDRIPLTCIYDRLQVIAGLELPEIRNWLAELG